MVYVAADDRYDRMKFNRVGRSGLMLPAISLGLWHNFGYDGKVETMRAMCHRAFDLGITHFDLANNYGPPPGSAEEFFGTMTTGDFKPYRDELIISTKAGWRMWPGPYGEYGSRKYLFASLEQSLKRMQLDYVDIFYSHRFDADTPLEETIGALDSIVRQGKALYVGISSYSSAQTREAAAIARDLGTPIIIHQPRYSMLDRWTERDHLLDTLEQEGMGCIVFSPLEQGVLSDRYLKGIPADSRVRHSHFLQESSLSEANLSRVASLNTIAASRGQSLAQMALSWVLRDPRMTSALIGVSRVSQIEDAVAALDKSDFSDEELADIDAYAIDGMLKG
ncbi:L-glyceraldehyde 3-phosphate reductase [Kaistia algarum]|uniref:L-glyceraldehyde 3-phosphate reductase n=1 Tax=Kaistia algarum TaxID=2083279 RepID=UPI000CE8C29E|nr:L-glyceraldehyde 3-phosphate reductase [Kaistia algarum]MCX5515565.1 L-glyceraldehyde 3-phosphate reductase [Kaistia algarum]PPE81038.1 L-glyceraldehyde 3-phosphate reductase [Kaistia algarum]